MQQAKRLSAPALLTRMWMGCFLALNLLTKLRIFSKLPTSSSMNSTLSVPRDALMASVALQAQSFGNRREWHPFSRALLRHTSWIVATGHIKCEIRALHVNRYADARNGGAMLMQRGGSRVTVLPEIKGSRAHS